MQTNLNFIHMQKTLKDLKFKKYNIILVSNKPEYYVKKILSSLILINTLVLYLEEILLHIENLILNIYMKP